MDIENRKSRIREWFKRKNRRADAAHWNQVSDDSEDDGLVRSLETDPCILTNELRIFVGTWNVAGRSPVGSLSEDVDEWLNLKDAADMYVLGFQEIVPLKTRNVIGIEDPTEATNWNLLIGKTLNDKYGCRWLTPMLNPISSENYHFVEIPDLERRASSRRQSGFTRTEASKTQKERGTSKYKLMASKKMVGVFISVWMKKEVLRKSCISNVGVSSVACGIMGCLGNKGSVAVSMSIEGKSFCFIAAHLASGEKNGDEGRRNRQVSEIFRRTSFPRSSEDANPHPLNILGHDLIFWFGDLNYRLCLEDVLARDFIKKQDWKALQKFDQLRKELNDGGVFEGWQEGNIKFAPTYKYSSSNCNRYSGALPGRSGEKQRTPAWCDRILWYGKGVRQLSYFRSESKFSDHRPVSALFSIPIEVINVTNPRKNFPTRSFLPIPSWKMEPINSNEGTKTTLLSLIAKESVKDIGALPKKKYANTIAKTEEVQS